MDWSWKTSGQPSTVFKFLCCACKMTTIFCLVLFDKSIWYAHHDYCKVLCMGKGREIIDLIHDAHHLCTFSRISRLCFDSPIHWHLCYRIQVGWWVVSRRVYSTPPNHFSPPGHAWLTLWSIFIFVHLGACLQAREKGKKIHPSLVQGCH